LEYCPWQMAEEANPTPARWQDSTVASSESHAGAAQAGVEPGELLAQRFRVVRTLARGGMGLVIEELGASVALKPILPELADSPAAVDRLRREVVLARVADLAQIHLAPGRWKPRGTALRRRPGRPSVQWHVAPHGRQEPRAAGRPRAGRDAGCGPEAAAGGRGRRAGARRLTGPRAFGPSLPGAHRGRAGECSGSTGRRFVGRTCPLLPRAGGKPRPRMRRGRGPPPRRRGN
jgi:hypothetical protein